MTSSLTRLYDEQVFLDKFSLTGFSCSCVREISQCFFLTSTRPHELACCTYTRASFIVEKLVRLAFKPGPLSRKNCHFSRTHEQIKLVKENLLVCTGLQIMRVNQMQNYHSLHNVNMIKNARTGRLGKFNLTNLRCSVLNYSQSLTIH